MPITIDYGSPTAAGGAALAAGYGQYLERMRNSQQQERMQERGIQAQQQMAQFQAQQDANKILWNANNADVMANRDMGRAQTMGQFKQGLEQQQFGWQAEHQQGMQQNQFEQQRSMQEQAQEHAQQMQADQIRNQSPLIRQMRDLDATEAELQSGRGTRYDDNQFAEGIEGLNKKRQQLMGALRQPTPEEQKMQLQTEWETSTIDMGNGTRAFKGKNGWETANSGDAAKTPEGLQKKIDADLEAVRMKTAQADQVRQATQAAKQQESAAKFRIEQEKAQRDAFRSFYDENSMREVPDGKDGTKFEKVPVAEIKAMWKERQDAEAEIFGGPGGGQQGGGQQQQQAPPPNLAPEAQKLMKFTGQTVIPKVSGVDELPRDKKIVFEAAPGVYKIWDPAVLNPGKVTFYQQPRRDPTDLTGDYANMPND